MSTFAQFNGNGYYRVQNYYTGRYIFVMDDYGEIYTTAGDADMAAISLRGDTLGSRSPRHSDPASVLYINNVGGTSYNIASQGTSVHDIIGYYLTLKSKDERGETVYTCSATSSGVTLYLADLRFQKIKRYPYSVVSTQKPTYDTQKEWYLKAIDSNGDDEYFGIKPDIGAIDGKYYRSFYAAFPFKLKSTGMKAYYIDKIDGDNVEMVEFASDATIPSETPVVIECSSAEPSNNRLELINGTSSAIKDNVLKGVYFNHYNDSIIQSLNNPEFEVVGNHLKRTAYDANTMRVLGVKADGTLGFIKSETLDYIPANTAYLPVTDGSASEFGVKVVASGIESITVDKPASNRGVYTLQGVKVADDVSAIGNLSKGVYVVDGKKVLVK